jgi:hypothetical protein
MTNSATRRIPRGKGHSYTLDGEPVPGVTTIINQGVPKPALIDWAARQSAGYAIDNWAELAKLNSSERLRRIERARFEILRGASVRGTDVHQLALRLAAGQEVDVPEQLEGHIDAYLQFATDWQPVELLTEVVIGNRRHRYMGTLDTLAQLADGKTWLLDWKTGQSGIWPEAALQLAAYRHAEFYLNAVGNEQPLPRVDQAGCIWLRADGYDLVPVDTSPETFRVFLYAQQVARFCSDPRERYIGGMLAPPATKEAAQ